MKVAIAHDFLNQIGGAEKVTLALSEIFPEAPIYTLFFNPQGAGKIFSNKKIITSSLQKKAKLLKFRHKYLLPFMAKAVEEFNFTGFDVVISSQSAWMKGILTKPETFHISYCHTPTRFLWSDTTEYLAQQNLGYLKKFFVQRVINNLRIWDRLASERVDYWIANSFFTKRRIKKYYQKEAEVIYPPVDISRFKLSKEKKDFFLVVSRLSPYKQIELVIDAFNKLGLKLFVIGEGSQKRDLERKAKSNIKFFGFLSDDEVLKYYSECRAFIFPTFREDFGLTPIEAMACGKPVIAAGIGGSRETVKEGITGEFFSKPDPDYLIGAIRLFLKKEKSYKPQDIRNHALRFDKKIFFSKIKRLVENKYKEFKEA